MSIVQIVTILGMIPLFSMRTFLPAFLAALFLTYPEYFPGMGDVPPAPEGTFITKDWVLIALGILSVLEIIGDKSSSIRNFLKDAETYLKPLFFLIINLSLLDETSTEILREVQWAAFNPNWILLIFGALVVHWLSKLRRDFISFLEDIDEDDNFYIGKLSSWLEDSLVLFGFVLVIWAGVIMVAIYAGLMALFVLTKKTYVRKLEKQKIACINCGEKNLPFAVKCYNCKTQLPKIHQVGIFGQRKKKLVHNLQRHKLHLVSHRKCPDCGNKLNNARLFGNCNTCGTPVFEAPTVNEFVKYQDKKFYRITGLSILLGFIPVLGFLVSALLANVYLFSPYRRYIPQARSFVTKLFIKFLTFFLFLLGIALGFIAAPIYIVMRYYIWKHRFLSLKNSFPLNEQNGSEIHYN